jgi:hypothetical protein
MKKIVFLLFVICIVFSSCGKKEEVKKEDGKKEVATSNAFKDLRYSDPFEQEGSEAHNTLVKTSGGVAFSLHITTRSRFAEYTAKFTEKFQGKYPMLIEVENDQGTKINRINLLFHEFIEVIVRGYSPTFEGLKEYNNVDSLKTLLAFFDLEGISKLDPNGNYGAKDFTKFMPKFEVKK